MNEKNTKIITNLERKQKVLLDKLSVNNDIALTAYFLWKKKGRPQNSDLENWVEAERIIKNK